MIMEPLIQLLLTFFKIGLFSIGGGYAIIPLIQAQVVDQLGWISQQTFTDIITISQMTPGPLAVNTSTFIGIQISGIGGAVLATVGCILSGVCISALLYRFFRKYRSSSYIFEVLDGLKASSLGLIISAAAAILLLAFTGSDSIKNGDPVDWISVVMFFGCLAALRKWKANPILLMAISGAAGLLIY